MKCTNPDCPDIELFGVQGVYREGISLCPKCGSTLVDDSPGSWQLTREDPEQTPSDSSELAIGVLSEDIALPSLTSKLDDDFLIPVAAFDYRCEADLLASMLWASGIPAEVNSDDCGFMSPALGLATEAFVEVRASDLEEVIDLLDTTLDESQSDHLRSEVVPEHARWYRSSKAAFTVGIYVFTVILMPVALIFAVQGLNTLPSPEDDDYRMASRRLLVLATSAAYFSLIAILSFVLSILVFCDAW